MFRTAKKTSSVKNAVASSMTCRTLVACFFSLWIATTAGCGERSMVAAVESGNLSEVKSLVARNPNLANARIRGGFPSDLPVLHAAINRRHISVAEFLVKSGANANARDSIGKTALHYAAERQRIKLVNLLLKHGADVNALDSVGQSALYVAVKGHNKALAEILRKHGANDMPMIHQAVAFEDEGGLRRMLDASPGLVAETDAFGATPLHYSAEQGNLRITQLLFAVGANVRARCKRGRTPIYGAVLGGSAAVAEFLLSNGAAADLKAKGNRDLLHLAVSSGDSGLVGLLLAYDVEVNTLDDFGETALMVAAGKNVADGKAVRIARVLLDAGASVNSESKQDEWTALHFAAFWDKPLVTRLLLERGARPDAANADGKTPLELADQRGSESAEAAIRAFSPRQCY